MADIGQIDYRMISLLSPDQAHTFRAIPAEETNGSLLVFAESNEDFPRLALLLGKELVLEKNIFVERVLPSSIIRNLEDEEQREYTRPFRNAGEDRRPTLTWPRQIPIAGEPEDVVKIVDEYSAWLSKTSLPKLFINADPGSILVGAQRDFCRTWPNQTEITVKGLHFIQEDSPHEIGKAIAQWRSHL